MFSKKKFNIMVNDIKAASKKQELQTKVSNPVTIATKHEFLNHNYTINK